ncbi:hypothetical protein ACIHFD_36185 [Nonomuraea sp. NPDC051941]|uniref:hypothetical protein n=1 Tax=Nonomuraea sp. NPDC051941 TaxID=3364373 RepID=UPI0037CAD7A8
MSPLDSYLRSADAAQLLYVMDGRPYVAGEFVDGITGDRHCLVEYCDPALLSTAQSVRSLRDALSGSFTDADVLTIRVRTPVDLPPPWERAVTYVRLTDSSTQPIHQAKVSIVEATSDYMRLIEDWLVRAFQTGYEKQGRAARLDAARRAARTILESVDRRSYVAIAGGVPVGHATLLTRMRDEVTDEEYADFVDMFVEPGPSAKDARDGLLSAVITLAGKTGMELVGNVVHQKAATATMEHGRRVLESLWRKGWQVDHVDWRLAP